MRISSGILKGLPLDSPTTDATRPSSERLRQSVFNVLRNRIEFEGLIVADLFAGTGALGLEAVSNGASRAIFIERDKNAAACLRSNVERVRTSFAKQRLPVPQLDVFVNEVGKAYEKLPLLGLVFADPPYDKKELEALIQLEDRFSKVTPGGLIVLEEREGVQVDLKSSSLTPLFDKKYGEGSVYFLEKMG